jgi:tetratricopeptide (TPR) repeat protein
MAAAAGDDGFSRLMQVFKTESGGRESIQQRVLLRVVQGLDPTWTDENLCAVLEAAGACKGDAVDYEALLRWLFRKSAADSGAAAAPPEAKVTSATPLRQHYLSPAYHTEGLPMDAEGTGYEYKEAGQCYFYHDSGFQVLEAAVDLVPEGVDLAAGAVRVLFHYTGDPTFHLIIEEHGLSENTLALLQPPNGKGIYLSGLEPAELWRAQGEKDRKDQSHTKHCIPFLVPEELVVQVEGGEASLPDLWLISVEKPRRLLKAAAAGSLRQKAAKLRSLEATLGPEDIKTLGAMNELSFLFEAQDMLKEAVELSRRLLKVSEDNVGPSDPSTLTNAANLAFLLERNGNMAEAESLARRALEGRKQVLGADHADTNTSINNLAHLLEAMGKVEEAALLFKQELEWCTNTFGSRSQQARESTRNYSRFCKEHEVGVEYEKARVRRKRYVTGTF